MLNEEDPFKAKISKRCRIICLYWEDAGLKISDVKLACLRRLSLNECDDYIFYTCFMVIKDDLNKFYGKCMIYRRKYGVF